MAKVHFKHLTIIKGGTQLADSVADIDDAYAADLVRLNGVSYVEAPKPAPKKQNKKKKEED